MGDIAIRVENLSKQYRIGSKWTEYKTLRDTLMDTLGAPLRRIAPRLCGRTAEAVEPDETIWALRAVSFEVKRGEVVGIIGRNGAGKSTLLSILSRITAPTSGFAEIHGRVGSLLEVGVGFNVELTGRENIYLNGAILGMKRVEIERKFDEIVDFAEVEKFIDTPVKHYSSGMYLRLAFAVAAHLEPEILIVDEVLAVGDERFRKKCINKIQDVGQQGRTVFFVSHDMSNIFRLCERAILLDEGRIQHDGPPRPVVSTYLCSELGTTAEREWVNPTKAPGHAVARLRAVRVRDKDGRIAASIDIQQPIRIELEYNVLKPGYMLRPNLHLYNEEGVQVFWTHDMDPTWQRQPRPIGCFVSTVWIPGNFLAEGTMVVSVGCETVDPIIFQFSERDVVAFRVIDNLNRDSARGDYHGHIPGVVRPLLQWSTQFSASPEL